MSGRKASEVSALLKNGRSTRSGAMNMLESSYNDIVDATRKYEDELELAKSSVAKIKVSMDTAEQEFPEPADEIKRSIEKLRKKMNASKVLVSESSCSSIYRSLKNSFEAADSEADAIAQSIRFKSHYCDHEYAQANRVAKTYNELRQSVYDMNNRFQTDCAACANASVEIQRIMAQMDSLVKQAKALEKNAKDIKTLRENAVKAKDTVNVEFNSIDERIAKKFLKKDYTELRETFNKFLSSSDANVVKAVSNITALIKNFSVKLSNEHEEFLRKQNITKSALESLKTRVNRGILKDPFEVFKKDSPRELSLIEFLDDFCQGKYSESIQASISNATSLFKKENFEQADKVIADVMKVVDDASSLAAQTHERRMQTIDNALTIRGVMKDLNYDVSAKMKRDDDGNFMGYTITCSAGDEEIVMDNVNVGSDGQLNIDIDHTESSKGTCHQSWKKIQRSLMENGVPVQDILKDGQSVIYPERVNVKKTSSNQNTVNSLH